MRRLTAAARCCRGMTMMPHHPIEPGSVRSPLGLIKLGETDLDGVFHRVVRAAREDLTGADDVSITVLGPTGPYTAAATGYLSLRLDERQYAIEDGPCLQAARDQVTVSISDTARDTRWKGWPAHASEEGVGSVLSVALPILDDVGGALNIYGGTRNAFRGGGVRAAENFAAYAVVTLGNAHLYHRTARLAEQMNTAMQHRAVIEQAKGIIMRERRCSPDEAFAVLTKSSQDSNRKVRDLAASLVADVQSTVT